MDLRRDSALSPRRSMDSGRVRALAVGALLLVGCDVPTGAPVVEQRWDAPLTPSAIPVGELLPAGVAEAGGALELVVPAAAAARTLGALCPACVSLSGLTAPVPPFTGGFEGVTALPADVASAELTEGSAAVTIRSGLPFDPLAGGGRLTVAVRDGTQGRVLGELELDGARGDALPAGATV